MINDICKLTKSLRENTPEQLLMKEIRTRRSEIVETLKAGKIFSITDVCGRTIKFIPLVQ